MCGSTNNFYIFSIGFNYSGMQSDGNKFCGYVVLDIFHLSCRILRPKIWQANILESLFSKEVKENAHLTHTDKKKETHKIGFKWYNFVSMHFCIPKYLVKAVQDDISAKPVPIWFHHTVVEPHAKDVKLFVLPHNQKNYFISSFDIYFSCRSEKSNS